MSAAALRRVKAWLDDYDDNDTPVTEIRALVSLAEKADEMRRALEIARTAIDGNCYLHEGVDGLPPHHLDKGDGIRVRPCEMSANELAAYGAIRAALAPRAKGRKR